MGWCGIRNKKEKQSEVTTYTLYIVVAKGVGGVWMLALVMSVIEFSY